MFDLLKIKIKIYKTIDILKIIIIVLIIFINILSLNLIIYYV